MNEPTPTERMRELCRKFARTRLAANHNRFTEAEIDKLVADAEGEINAEADFVAAQCREAMEEAAKELENLRSDIWPTTQTALNVLNEYHAKAAKAIRRRSAELYGEEKS